MRIWMLAVFLGLAALAVGCNGDPAEDGGGQKVFRFTAIPDQNTTQLKQRFDPVAEYLAGRLGVEVEYVPARDYPASIAMFKNGDAQMAWFGGLTGVQVRHAVPGARAIAMGDIDPDFHSYFVAHESTGLERSDEFPLAIADLRFTFGSASSTSGRLMPEYYIIQHSGKTATEFFDEVPGYSGKHELTAKAVESGAYQAGAMNYETYDTMVAEGKLDPARCRIIWKTPAYADYNMTIHPEVETTFGPGFIEKVQKALLEMSDPALLAAFSRDKLIPASDEDFAAILDVARQLDLLR